MSFCPFRTADKATPAECSEDCALYLTETASIIDEYDNPVKRTINYCAIAYIAKQQHRETEVVKCANDDNCEDELDYDR